MGLATPISFPSLSAALANPINLLIRKRPCHSESRYLLPLPNSECFPNFGFVALADRSPKLRSRRLPSQNNPFSGAVSQTPFFSTLAVLLRSPLRPSPL